MPSSTVASATVAPPGRSAERREPPRRLVDDLLALAEGEAAETAAGGLVVVEDARGDGHDAGARHQLAGELGAVPGDLDVGEVRAGGGRAAHARGPARR